MPNLRKKEITIDFNGNFGHVWGVITHYRSGTVNSKSFVGKVLLRIKQKFELTYAL